MISAASSAEERGKDNNQDNNYKNPKYYHNEISHPPSKGRTFPYRLFRYIALGLYHALLSGIFRFNSVLLIQFLNLFTKYGIDFLRSRIVICRGEIRLKLRIKNFLDIRCPEIFGQTDTRDCVIILCSNRHNQHQSVLNAPVVKYLINIFVNRIGSRIIHGN